MSEENTEKFIIFLIAIIMVFGITHVFKEKSDKKNMQEVYYNQCISEGVITDFECRAMAIEMSRPNEY